MLEAPQVADQRRTRLKEWGTSRAIRIPKAVCEYTSIDLDTELTMDSGIDAEGPFILIRCAPKGHRDFGAAPRISMDEAFEGYEGSYVPHEADWGADVGAEAVA